MKEIIDVCAGWLYESHEGILQNMKHVAVYLDDILVTGANDEEHLRNLEGSEENKDKWIETEKKQVFLGKEVIFPGHRISAAGVQPVAHKVKVIQEAPDPQSASELKACLGLL